MELTRACLDEIALAAQEVGNGKLVVTLQSRPEDHQSFDLVCAYEKRFRVTRKGKEAVPTVGKAQEQPADKW